MARETVILKQPFVLFLIGMRINKWWKPWHWLPVFWAMGPMLKELRENPELGLLGVRAWFGRTIILVQYWESHDKLQAFATSTDHPHLPAWRHFNRRLKDTKSVGVWHETYQIEPGQFEGIYSSMPAFGLGTVFDRQEASGPLATAKGRLTAAQDANIKPPTDA
ncbi:MAG: DUF4188 domain-containing protein [Pseudomonadota bacterium]